MRAVFVALAAGAVITSGAQAGISFSFADPVPGRQLTNVADGGSEAGIGALSYDTSAVLVFYVDASEIGAGTLTFSNARMEMDMEIGAAFMSGSVMLAPVTGTFTIYDFTGGVRNDILIGNADSGTFVRITNTNSILFSDPDFTYSPGPALLPLLPSGVVFVPSTEAVFTLTDVQTPGGSNLTTAGGTFNSFEANASFTGNTEVVPSPAGFALLAIAAGANRRRR